MKNVLIGIGIFLLVIIVGAGLQLAGIEWYKFIAPKKEEARRNVFEETKSYNQGVIQDLARYKVQYETTKSQSEKDAIATTIRTMYADYDVKKLPYGLQAFFVEVRGY